MPRYVALLRGVSPMNAKMPELKSCFEKAGFTNVATVLSSGNVVFDSPTKSESALEKKIEAAMKKHLDRTFLTIVRSIDDLLEILASDPYKDIKLKQNTKRIITFMRTPPTPKPKLPIAKHEATLLVIKKREAFSFYTPNPNASTFMQLIEKTLGKDVTTRTWDTVAKLSRK